MMRKTARAALVAASLQLSTRRDVVGAAAQVLEIGADQSPAGLDPHIATAFSTFLDQLADLRGPDADRPEPARDPGAGRVEWTISDDQKTYTFTLRPNVTFMTAHDGGGGRGRELPPRAQPADPARRWRSRIDMVTEVRAPDTTHVVLVLSQPAARC